MSPLVSVLLLVAATLVGSASAVPSPRSSFTDCLSGIAGLKVVTPSSSDYAPDSEAFNRRLAFKPAAIVYP